MAVEILNSCRLQFNRELTSALPAKLDPKHQNVVFTKSDGSIGGVFSRETLRELQGSTEQENLMKYGLSDEELLSGYWESRYAYLRPDAAESLDTFRFNPS
ncbi:MAG: hypothetical protein JKY11_05830 [Alphaproteobacteria bacterium]|nr:hypothetical protein [Alphaproteobacteria bacterium]